MSSTRAPDGARPARATAAASPSILLLQPYFGPLPSYADLFFRSCRENPTVNWLLVTDQEVSESRLPRNVAVWRSTLAEVRRRAEDVLGFETALRHPYKLSDFRPAYGLMFANEVKGYDFWGHCDMDMLFGDVRRFLTDDVLGGYTKVLIHGHLSLYRNVDEANNYFRLGAPGIHCRDVFMSPKARAFDEFGGMRHILKHHDIPFFRQDGILADIDRNQFRLCAHGSPNYSHQCFYWEGGRVFKAFWDGEVGTREYLCIHLQKRPMRRPPPGLAGADAWYIAPREFLPKSGQPATPAEMDQLNPGDALFDLKRRACTALWHMKAAVNDRLDPWPRRS